MTQFAPVYGAIQFAGGLYLIWLGIGAWRSAKADKTEKAPPLDAPRADTDETRDGIGRAVMVGAWLSLGNPKIVIFFSSIFVALLPPHAPLWVRLAAIAIVGAQELAWDTTVAFVFPRPRVQAAYARARGDRADARRGADRPRRAHRYGGADLSVFERSGYRLFAGHSRLRPATAGSREENATKQKPRAPALIAIKRPQRARTRPPPVRVRGRAGA